MILRDLAAAWVKTNCRSADVRRDFLRPLDDALRGGVGCSFLVGSQLTRTGRPYLLHAFCGELFAFQLTQQQAARLRIRKDSMLATSGGCRQHHQPKPEPAVRLERVEVDNRDWLDPVSPITGTLYYHADQQWQLPLAVQVAVDPRRGAGMRGYDYLDELAQGSGSVRFSMPPIAGPNDPEGAPCSAVLALFFRLCTVDDPEQSGPEILGEPLILPKQLPETVTSEVLGLPPLILPRPSRTPLRFRALSDIRAVLVDVA